MTRSKLATLIGQLAEANAHVGAQLRQAAALQEKLLASDPPREPTPLEWANLDVSAAAGRESFAAALATHGSAVTPPPAVRRSGRRQGA